MHISGHHIWNQVFKWYATESKQAALKATGKPLQAGSYLWCMAFVLLQG